MVGKSLGVVDHGRWRFEVRSAGASPGWRQRDVGRLGEWTGTVLWRLSITTCVARNQSIVQCISYTATVTGAEFLSTIDVLKVHLTRELNHAQMLAEQISFHGGTPATDVPSVNTATGRGALQADLRLEETQLDRYRERFGQALDLGLADVAEVLRPLLEQTQEHVTDLQIALGE